MNNKIKRELFSVPNILTYFRILLIPVFVIFYLNSAHNFSYYIASVMILAASGITDVLDGKIARKYDQITELGKLLDPVADKLSQCTILACLVLRYKLFLLVLAIFVVKEITMAVLALVFYRKGRKLKGAHWYGKAATSTFYLITIFLLLVPHDKVSEELSTALILLSGAVMLFAFIMYIRVYIIMWKDHKENKPNKRY
ncbi:MAG: CDP-alcohol phosphatidyltransferase family protein [Ruminococcaceae bacterium]|nr:CDP-alcohol phosphatidyltransferase family protein [Oscillospiraceae bacterium]